MSLTSSDLALIRDEVGDSPDDATLQGYYAELSDPSWIPTALRVLRRRRGSLAAGGVSSVSIPGVVSVGMTASLKSIDTQIDRLERAYQAWLDAQAGPCEQTGASDRLRRHTYRDG